MMNFVCSDLNTSSSEQYTSNQSTWPANSSSSHCMKMARITDLPPNVLHLIFTLAHLKDTSPHDWQFRTSFVYHHPPLPHHERTLWAFCSLDLQQALAIRHTCQAFMVYCGILVNEALVAYQHKDRTLNPQGYWLPCDSPREILNAADIMEGEVTDTWPGLESFRKVVQRNPAYLRLGREDGDMD